jgi:redox-sensing transcriptional repressor
MRSATGADGEQPISMTVIRRIPAYLNVVRKLREEGVEWVSSHELAKACAMTPSSVRQDLSHFGKFGLTRHGYNVMVLNQALEQILGVDNAFNLVIVGAGNLGRAIANYESFRRRGFFLRAIFDNHPEVIGQEVAGLAVRPLEQMAQVVREQRVHLGAICVPGPAAQAVAERLVAAGVAGIWNFAPTQLVVPSWVAVEDVHLSVSLLTLGYLVRERARQREEPVRPPGGTKATLRGIYGGRKGRI